MKKIELKKLASKHHVHVIKAPKKIKGGYPENMQHREREH